MSEPASLIFKSYEISKVIFEKPDNFIEGAFSVNIDFQNFIDTENKNLIKSVFIVGVTTEDKIFNLQVQTTAHFEITGNASETLVDTYTRISIPAIVYPYIRAFISSFVVQTGMKAIIIPPVNFTVKMVDLPKNDDSAIKE